MKKKKLIKIQNIPVNCGYDELVDPNDLQPHPMNPNKHPAEQIESLANDIIRENNIRDKIVVSTRSGYIVTGHGQRMAALKLGLKKYPVEYQDFDTLDDELFHMTAHNAIGEQSKTDRSKVNHMLQHFDPSSNLKRLGLNNFVVDLNELLDQPEVHFSEVIDEESNYVVLVFRNQVDWLAARTHFGLETVSASRQDASKKWSSGVGRVLDGAKYLHRIKE